MERLHMYQIRDLIYRLRQGESDRRVARDLGLSRHTVQKYRALAVQHEYLDPSRALPTPQELLASLGPPPPPPQHPSTVTPYQEVVEDLLAQGVELTTILQRLRDDHGYRGSYSSLRRFVRTLRPKTPDVCVRVQVAPGEEAQVDFGPVGRLVDPRTGLPRSAFVFAMTLGFSRYLYAELVFDQKIGTWIACHRHAFEFFGAAPRRIVPDYVPRHIIRLLCPIGLCGRSCHPKLKLSPGG
jgi:transposase